MPVNNGAAVDIQDLIGVKGDLAGIMIAGSVIYHIFVACLRLIIIILACKHKKIVIYIAVKFHRQLRRTRYFYQYGAVFVRILGAGALRKHCHVLSCPRRRNGNIDRTAEIEVEHTKRHLFIAHGVEPVSRRPDFCGEAVYALFFGVVLSPYGNDVVVAFFIAFRHGVNSRFFHCCDSGHTAGGCIVGALVTGCE